MERGAGHAAAPAETVETTSGAIDAYYARYLEGFPPGCLAGQMVVVYQHSCVSRDMLVEIHEALGARIRAIGRSDRWTPRLMRPVRGRGFTGLALFDSLCLIFRFGGYLGGAANDWTGRLLLCGSGPALYVVN